MSIDFVYTQLNVKSFLFQTIQFTVSMQFMPIWPIDRTLLDATTPGQSGPGKEGVLHIPQSSSNLTIWSCHIQEFRCGVLPLCKDAVGVFYSPSWLGKLYFDWMTNGNLICERDILPTDVN